MRRVLSSRVCVLMRCNVLGTRVIYIFIKASTSFPNRTSFPLGEGVFFNQSYPKYIGLWVIYGTTSQAKRTKHISIGGDREGGMIITPPPIMFTSTFQTRWASSWANQESGLIKVRECAPQCGWFPSVSSSPVWVEDTTVVRWTFVRVEVVVRRFTYTPK